MPLFGKSQKSPAELVKALKEAVTALERGDKKAEKAQEDVSKNLVSSIRFFCCYSFLNTLLSRSNAWCKFVLFLKNTVMFNGGKKLGANDIEKL